jgi:alcohol dehydrogenase class IV
MSGGSYNYEYHRIENLAYEIGRNANTPERKAFTTLLKHVAEAAKAIEWNDSGDGDDRELDMIRKALGDDWKKRCLSELIEEAEELAKTIEIYVRNSKL